MEKEDFIDWLKNPITRTLFKMIKDDRDRAEDEAFNSTLSGFKKRELNRTYDEFFNYARLEVANFFLQKTFDSIYKDTEIDKEELENFINKIENYGK